MLVDRMGLAKETQREEMTLGTFVLFFINEYLRRDYYT